MGSRQMLLTAAGPDRPGLVKEISSVIHRCGANLEDSRMAVLAGDFALIILFSGEEGVLTEVQAQARTLESQLGFEIHFKPATPPADEIGHVLYRLEVTGVDHPGIVHRVSTVLAGLEVNVRSMESRLLQAAFHGTPMFELRAELQVPGDSDLESLHEQLEKVCDEERLTYDLDPGGE